MCEGDEITITGATTIIASRVTAYNLNVTTKITKVIDETYYNIEPTLDATPNANTTGGGALVKLEYRPSGIDINVNAIPISVLNPGDNIYITNHQKLIQSAPVNQTDVQKTFRSPPRTKPRVFCRMP